MTPDLLQSVAMPTTLRLLTEAAHRAAERRLRANRPWYEVPKHLRTPAQCAAAREAYQLEQLKPPKAKKGCGQRKNRRDRAGRAKHQQHIQPR